MLYVVNVVLNDILQGELSSCNDVCKHVNNTKIMHDACLGVCMLFSLLLFLIFYLFIVSYSYTYMFCAGDILGVKLLVKMINE